jgi:hypothetical protein
MADAAIIDSITDRLTAQLVTSTGQHASHDHVADVVGAAAASLVDAPVQLYVEVLVEHDARDTLRDEGLRRART